LKDQTPPAIDSFEMPNRKLKKRRPTFTTISAIESHGIQADPPVTQPRRAVTSPGTSPTAYFQIAGDAVHPIDGDETGSFILNGPPRRGSGSSHETADLMDHRVSPNGTQSVDPRWSNTGKQKYSSPSLVERWVRRRSSLSQMPLMRGSSTRNEYSALSDALEGDDTFAIAVDESMSGTAASNGGEPSDSFRHGFLDIESDEEPLNSKPSSRRASESSSLDDVCYPIDSPREIDSTTGGPKIWPDLAVLSEFAEEELRELSATESAAAAQPTIEDTQGDRPISPFTVPQDRGRVSVNETAAGGRLRPHRIVPWAPGKKEQFAPAERNYSIPGVDEKAFLEYRFTYFREDMEATIHSPTISGLLQPGQTFANLFPPRISTSCPLETARANTPSLNDLEEEEPSGANHSSISTSVPLAPSQTTSSNNNKKDQLDPTPFWLDVLNPTEEEMKVISRTFGIHPLTTEDIYLGETREKVELFRNYYLVCFRSIDTNSERQKSRRDTMAPTVLGLSGKTKTGYSELYGGGDIRRRGTSVSIKSDSSIKHRRRRVEELKPLNMYIIVFHEGVLSFHFAPTPHTVNVRRRGRLLRDYLTVSSDWISYALIDDITDGFAPMIEAIEEDVNMIDEAILRMHSGETDSDDDSDDEKADCRSSSSSTTSSELSNRQSWKQKGDMLRRIGECRKRVMSLLRLLGNKADVIKGFSKRCNEKWEVAPRNEIGLYLGDIQDHIVTMVQSLNHYEKLLARSHSNYLAQINIDMTRVNNDMNDVLSKITVLGTIVLPMNIVTGLWGMNVLVPGQSENNLYWFWGIVFAMFSLALVLFWIARRIYKIA
jgi:magnesium transporter